MGQSVVKSESHHELLDRIDFSSVDVAMIQNLNHGKFHETISMLAKKLHSTSWKGEEILLLSRILAVHAISHYEENKQIPSLLKRLLELLSLPQNKLSLLSQAFNPLWIHTPQPKKVIWKDLPEEFKKRIDAIPLYDNRLEIDSLEGNDQWITFKGSRPVLSEYEVNSLVKRILMNTLMAPEGTNIYEVLQKNSTLLECDVLRNKDFIKDVSITSDGDFSLAIHDIFTPGALRKELQKHVGHRLVIDEREASGIIGYRIQDDGSLLIKEVFVNELGLSGHSPNGNDKEIKAIKEFLQTDLHVAHIHTHPSPSFFSFVDVSLDEVGDIDGDMYTYFALNHMLDSSMSEWNSTLAANTPISGIVLIGYKTGFMYDPKTGTSIVTLS